jgi:S1-C subfamily serine protease
MRLTVVHTSGPRAETRQCFSGKQAIRLGRRSDNDLVFDGEQDATVSGHHAEIRLENGRVAIVDLGSTNGTWVDGERVTERELRPSDTARLGTAGGPEFRVEPGLAEPAVAPVTGEKQYGQRTVGMMIKQALAQAGLAHPGTTKSTDYFEALVDEKVRSTSSRLKWIVVAAISLLVAAGSVFGWYLWRRPSAVVQQFNYGDATGGGIAAQNRHAVFLLAGSRLPAARSPQDLVGFCTGFAIAQDLLVTNSHCVRAAGNHASVYALMNGVRGAVYPVTRMVAHPGYQPGEISPDVGLMRVAARLQHFVTMADQSELAQIAPGVPVFLYGFPGRLNKAEAPEATFIKGDIGRVTGFDQKLGDFGRNTLLQHSAYSTGGTSGSPMFNSSGHVIGINAGGYVENGQSLAGYNFGMRIDLVHSLYPLLVAGS